jgi:hypothetical protein
MAKSAKQRREYYENGRPGEAYGIWNSIIKRFVYGIREDTPKKAVKKLWVMAGKGAYCHRYDWKRIPDGFRNPPNPINY